jgi:hypothetical protein
MKKIIILLLIAICYGGIGGTAYAQSPSFSMNSSYSLSQNIEKLFVDFENALKEEENEMPPLYNNIQTVKWNLDTMKKLIRTELQNAKGFQIDFIPQYEIGQQGNIEKWAHDSIERYQVAVKNILLKSQYDLIGWEASTLDTVTRESYEEELIRLWKEADPDLSIDTANLFERVAPQYMWQDGVLAYWMVNPKAKLIGIQEGSLWKLNIEANKFDIPFSYFVAEFRLYVAVAKMIKAIRKNKSKQPIRAVIVMGAWHKADVTFIANALGIKMKVVDLSVN